MSDTVQTERFPWWVYWIVLSAILLFASWPIISVVVAGSLASSHGCTLHEGFSNPCLIGGTDWGETLYAMGVVGWFAIATLPLGGGALIVWTVMLIIHRLAWRRGAGAMG